MSRNPLHSFLDRTRAFAGARAAIAALELGLFPALADCARTPAELRNELELADSAITDCFFELLVTAGFLEESDGMLALSPMSRAMLASHAGIRSWGREMLGTYRSLADLEGLLRTGAFEDTETARFWQYKTADDRSGLDATAVDEYSRLMDASQEDASRLVADAYDFSAHRHVVDVGGGYGRLAFEIARRHPELRVTVLDLPGVCVETARRIEAEGLSDRVTCLACDFLDDPLPERVADLVLFCRVLHDWNDADAARLLERTIRTLQPGGTALVFEPMFNDLEPRREDAMPAALMLALLGGRRRSVQAYERLLEAAGYRDVSWRESGRSNWRLVLGVASC